MNINDTFGPGVNSYTRQQAINDGALIDVTETAREYGYQTPVAISCAAWVNCVINDADVSENEAARHAQWNTIDILMALAKAVMQGKGKGKRGAVLLFEVALTIRKDGARKNQWVTLKGTIDGGDDGKPVITIRLPNED